MKSRTNNGWRALGLSVLLLASACSVSEGAESTGGGELWDLMTFPNSPVEEYASIAAMAQAADLVVVGSVKNVAVGRQWGDSREPENSVASILVTIAVDEAIRGTLPDSRAATITVEHTIAGYSAADLAKVVGDDGIRSTDGRIAPLPTGRSLWFLRARGDEASGVAVLSGPYSPIGGVSYGIISPQGLVTESDGRARTPMAFANIDLSPEGRPSVAETDEEKLALEIFDGSFEAAVEQAR